MFEEFLQGIRTVAIAGHVHPDADCVGSALALFLYLQKEYPEVRATVYLEPIEDSLQILPGCEHIRHTCNAEENVDLMILVEISSLDRVGVAGDLVARAGKTLCFDNHITNNDTFTWKYNRPDASSTCEVVYGFLDAEKISQEIAAALFTGMAHDTGIFQYSSTSPETMRIAASLMETGIPFSKLIDETYYQKSYGQNQVLALAIQQSELLCDGRLIMSRIAKEERERYGVSARDLGEIVSELRNTRGTEVTAFLYELEDGRWKVSLRSRESFDVSRIAQQFGGGGHIRAAGCDVKGTGEEATAIIRRAIEAEL